MSLFEFNCPKCGVKTERMTQKPDTEKCLNCSTPLIRVYSKFDFYFKGGKPSAAH